MVLKFLFNASICLCWIEFMNVFIKEDLCIKASNSSYMHARERITYIFITTTPVTFLVFQLFKQELKRLRRNKYSAQWITRLFSQWIRNSSKTRELINEWFEDEPENSSESNIFHLKEEARMENTKWEESNKVKDKNSERVVLYVIRPLLGSVFICSDYILNQHAQN